MNSRDAILVTLALGTAGPPLPVMADARNDGKHYRIAVVASGTRERAEATLRPFFDEMRALGWIEDRNVIYEHAHPGDWPQDLPKLVAELVRREPDLVYALSGPAALAAKRATTSIPIVFSGGMNPVSTGLVTSLSRPGGNLTGVTTDAGSIIDKRIELLHEILPAAKRVGLLGDPTYPSFATAQARLAPVARALGLTIVVAAAANPEQFEQAVDSLAAQGAEAIVATSVLAYRLRARLVELATLARLPVVAEFSEMTQAGALFCYSASLAAQIRRSAYLVDQVLNGTRPGDIAVEQPTRFELVLNLKTAKALGITIPQSVLLRADEVIQ